MRPPWIFRARHHLDCAADPDAYCVQPGCTRRATHARPLAISNTGDLIEELTCCKHYPSA